MEGIREIAKSYYEKATEEEKKSVKEFFNKLDVNGDGIISLDEIKTSVTSWLSTEDVFKHLGVDCDGEGTLGFEEVTCLYYMEKRMNMVRCSECFDLLAGPYFSCKLCLGKSPNTYDLCCDCFRRGNVSSHQHSPAYMLDHHSLIRVLRDRTADDLNSQRKKEMEELREIAKAHYQAASPQVQSLAYHFYQSMDTDGDGWVNLSEFLSFMTQQGYSHMRNPRFFEELDRDSNGSLDFFEVMTLFYIIKSGRPFCNCCGRFIPGIFFACVECFKNGDTVFHLCSDCYRSSKCNHNHGGGAQFLDNYTLLQVRRDPALAQAAGFNSNNVWTSSSNAIIPINGNMYSYAAHPLDQGPNYSNALIRAPPSNRSNWKIALNALEFALRVGSIAGVAACTIM